MKRMGELADVPIEPDEQTRLLDECITSVPGVLGAGVPGGKLSARLVVLRGTAPC